jgi:peroxin-6
MLAWPFQPSSPYPLLFATQALTRKFHLARDVDLGAVVATAPPSFTGADFYALCSSALSSAIVRLTTDLQRLAVDVAESVSGPGGSDGVAVPVEALLDRLSEDEVTPVVTQHDFLAAMASTVPSVSPQEVQAYEEMRLRYAARPSQ